MDAATVGSSKKPEPQLLKTLQELIASELFDARYYAAFSKRTQDEAVFSLLLRFSREELLHARKFAAAYYIMTKTPYFPQIEIPIIPPYREALRRRYADESRDAEKYGNLAKETDDPGFKLLYAQTADEEAKHAREILKLIEDTQ